MNDNNKELVVEIDADLEDLVDGFLENRKKEIETISIAVKKQDFKSIHKITHDLIGAGKTYGFDFITEFGHRVKTAAHDEDCDQINTLVCDILPIFQNLKIVYVEID